MVERFSRERLRHEPQIRRLTVTAVHDVAPSLRRITLSDESLHGFTAPGPTDHVKVFFPDPATGVLSVPAPGEFRAPAPLGETRIIRDYTPREFRDASHTGGVPELDIDFFVHHSAGVAGSWAAAAQPGMQLAIAGPRGSALVPNDLSRAILVGDETAFPAIERWIGAVDPAVSLTVLTVTTLEATAEHYFAAHASRIDLVQLTAGESAETAAAVIAQLTALHLDENDFVFVAGEANTLIPIRKFLRNECGLEKAQVSVHGYWKHGVSALDHHAPLDPESPDE